MTVEEALALTIAPLKFGEDANTLGRRRKAIKLLTVADRIAAKMNAMEHYDPKYDFRQICDSQLEYAIQYPEYSPVAYGWWQYIKTLAEKKGTKNVEV